MALKSFDRLFLKLIWNGKGPRAKTILKNNRIHQVLRFNLKIIIIKAVELAHKVNLLLMANPESHPFPWKKSINDKCHFKPERGNSYYSLQIL